MTADGGANPMHRSGARIDVVHTADFLGVHNLLKMTLHMGITSMQLWELIISERERTIVLRIAQEATSFAPSFPSLVLVTLLG